jgi:hypothetical protein
MRRQKREQVIPDARAFESPLSSAALSELQAILDEEIQRLSANRRTAFVLCVLEGKSRAEAMRMLGCTEGTLASRLARARETLQKRLTARGITLSAALGAVALSPAATSASIPTSLAQATVDSALAFALNHGADVASSTATSLANGVLKSMFLTKLKFGSALLLAASLAVVTTNGLNGQSELTKKSPPQAPPVHAENGKVAPKAEARERLPESDDEKAVATLELVYFRDWARGRMPAIVVGCRTATYSIAASAACVVPAGTPLAVDGAFFNVVGKPAIAAEHDHRSGITLAVHRGAGTGTSYRLKEPAVVAVGDALSAMIRDQSNDWRVRPGATTVTALDRSTVWHLNDRDIHHKVDKLFEVTGMWPEGTPLFKNGKLAGLVLLGSRFSEKDNRSYVVPAEQVAALCAELLPQETDAPAFVLPGRDVLAVGFTAGGSDFVSLSSAEEVTVRTWDVAERKLKREVKLSSKQSPFNFRFPFTLSADGKRVLASADNGLGIWEVATGQLDERALQLKITNIGCLASTPDLSLVACGEPSSATGRIDDKLAAVWDVQTGAVVQTVKHIDAVQLHCVALSPDGKWLATGSQQNGTCVWDVSTGQLAQSFLAEAWSGNRPDREISKLAAKQILCLSFSPDSRQLAIGDMLGVKLVDVRSGKLAHRSYLPFRFGPSGLVYSKDGQRLARISRDKLVPIWSTQSGKLLAELPTEALAGSFSDDGQWFAVGLPDQKNSVAVWRIGQ